MHPYNTPPTQFMSRGGIIFNIDVPPLHCFTNGSLQVLGVGGGGGGAGGYLMLPYLHMGEWGWG